MKPYVKISDYLNNTAININPGIPFVVSAHSDVLQIQLQDTSGVAQWQILAISSSDNTTIYELTITQASTINGYATVILPATDGSWLLESIVNGGVESNQRYSFKVMQTSGRNYLAFGETYESSSVFGWISSVNKPLYNDRLEDSYTNGTDLVSWLKCENIGDAIPGTQYWGAPDCYLPKMKPFGGGLPLYDRTALIGEETVTVDGKIISDSGWDFESSQITMNVILEQPEEGYVLSRYSDNSTTNISYGIYYNATTKKYNFKWYYGSQHSFELYSLPTSQVHQLTLRVNQAANQVLISYNGVVIMTNQHTSPLSNVAANGSIKYGHATLHDCRVYGAIKSDRVIQALWESTL